MKLIYPDMLCVLRRAVRTQSNVPALLVQGYFKLLELDEIALSTAIGFAG